MHTTLTDYVIFAVLVADLVALVVWINRRQRRRELEAGVDPSEGTDGASEELGLNPGSGLPMLNSAMDYAGNPYGSGTAANHEDPSPFDD